MKKNKKIIGLCIVLVIGIFLFSKRFFKSTTSTVPELTVCQPETILDEVFAEQFFSKERIRINLQKSPDSNFPKSCDVILALDSTISALVKNHAINPLEMEKIPNRNAINAKFLNSGTGFQNRYTIPFVWGTLGLGVNSSYVSDTAVSWKLLFNPRYKSKIILRNDYRETMGIAMKYLGLPLNSTNPNDLMSVKTLLTSQRNVNRASTETVVAKLIRGEFWIAPLRSNEISELKKYIRFKYIVPREGSELWTYNFVISSHSRKTNVSHRFINAILDPVVVGAFFNSSNYASCNSKVHALLDHSKRNNAELYLDPEIMEKLELKSNDDSIKVIWKKIWEGKS